MPRVRVEARVAGGLEQVPGDVLHGRQRRVAHDQPEDGAGDGVLDLRGDRGVFAPQEPDRPVEEVVRHQAHDFPLVGGALAAAHACTTAERPTS